MPKQSKPRQSQREKVIEDIVRVNAILRRAVETAARHKGINDLNVVKLRTFVEIVRVGDTPSREELQYFAQGIERFLDARGQESLDEIFGPRKAQQGTQNFFTEWEKLERDGRLLLHVHLGVIAGMTKNEATDYVAENYAAPPVVHGRPVRPRGNYFDRTLTGHTLRSDYSRSIGSTTWADIFDEAIRDVDSSAESAEK